MDDPVFIDDSTPGVTYIAYSDEDRAALRPSEPIFHIQRIKVVSGITTIQDNRGIQEKCAAWTDRENPALWE